MGPDERCGARRSPTQPARPTSRSCDFTGVSPFFQGFPQLITRVSWDLASQTSAVKVEAGTLAAKNGTLRTSADNLDVGSDPSISSYIPTPGLHSALQFVTVALRQVGDKYVYGVEDDLNDPNPTAFDCSELVQWAAAQVGVTFTDGSSSQWHAIQKAGTTLSIAQAMKTRMAICHATSL